MNRIQGKKVLITGASAGIGEACAKAFASYGADLMLSARRIDRLQALKDQLHKEHGVQVYTRELDVRNRADVEAYVDDLEVQGLVPDVLVNNAGKARGLDKLHEGDINDWDEMIDTNVKGLLYMSRAVIPLMVKRDSGHIVNIGSIAGHQVYPMGAVYNASKFAVRAINEGMNLDLVGTNLKVTSIDPGLVETEFSIVRFHGDAERAKAVYKGYQPLTPEDIADIVCFVVNTPAHVSIVDVVVLATAQRGVYVVHKEGV